MITEADTCRMYVLPKLREAGWKDDQIREQKYFTDGRIVLAGRKHLRRPGKKADYLLHYRPDFRLAIIQGDELRRLQAETAAELDALLPSILDRAFKGEL